jgi:hypothetical protein
MSRISTLVKSLKGRQKQPITQSVSVGVEDEKQIEALEWEANKKDRKFDDLSDSFPEINVDAEQLNTRWADIVRRHTLLGVPCFSCKLFVKCREEGEVNPEKCEFITHWFQSSRLEASGQ